MGLSDLNIWPTTCGLKGTLSGRQIVVFTSGNLQAKRRLSRP
jgi:hypothetical protein